MSDNAIAARGQALEEQFFNKHNEVAAQKLKEKHTQEVDREGISHLTGITDPAVLSRLVQMHLKPETMAAFGLYPLVEVAWADGACDAKEKAAVLQAANDAGLSHKGPAHAILEGWLMDKPPKAMHVAWFGYVKALGDKLTPAEKSKMKSEVLGRAQKVAEKSGGILGIGAVSSAEAAILKQLEDAFL